MTGCSKTSAFSPLIKSLICFQQQCNQLDWRACQQKFSRSGSIKVEPYWQKCDRGRWSDSSLHSPIDFIFSDSVCTRRRPSTFWISCRVRQALSIKRGEWLWVGMLSNRDRTWEWWYSLEYVSQKCWQLLSINFIMKICFFHLGYTIASDLFPLCTVKSCRFPWLLFKLIKGLWKVTICYISPISSHSLSPHPYHSFFLSITLCVKDFW